MSRRGGQGAARRPGAARRAGGSGWEAGAGEAATLGCGAPNAAAGQTVAVAQPGAVMPDGTKLGRAKLRGVLSEGMILAENELEIDESGDSIKDILVPDDLMLACTRQGDAELAPGTPDRK